MTNFNYLRSRNVEHIQLYQIRCLNCGNSISRTPDCTTPDDLIVLAHKKGWQLVDENVYCPDCVCEARENASPV